MIQPRNALNFEYLHVLILRAFSQTITYVHILSNMDENAFPGCKVAPGLESFRQQTFYHIQELSNP